MEFDWNPAKCGKNIAERGIDFAAMVVGFADRARKVVRDTRKDYGEARYNMLAKVEGRVFHVTSPNAARSPGSSPRKANKREQRRRLAWRPPGLVGIGAGSGTRTHTTLPSRDFKSLCGVHNFLILPSV
jgi:uncharacterized DUF497 family protein